MLDSEPPPLTTPFVSPTLNSPFLSLGLFWEALKGGNEQSCGQAGAPMTSVQKDASFPLDIEARIENLSWWFFPDLSTMVQWSVLKMANKVSGFKKVSKSVHTSSQTDLKSCSLANSDEWNLLAVKHHLSSSDFGWQKEMGG
ncbi:hypothetical protein V6N11_049861 [Hibiscus sabdariffa]|uniref:Uncharacterized protein n=1 Tax=Hibiscus sabdariffa TaxID=183260 RepID=A0ABR2T849_9ROSI